MNNALWITWEDQRRNKSLSKALGVELFQLDAKIHRLLRYPVLLSRTLWIFLSKRPGIIFAQNPSIILATFAVLYGKIMHKKVVIDAHNAGVYPFEGRVAWANRWAGFLFRNAFLTIVTNDSLKQYVNSRGGCASILPDPFPEIEVGEIAKLKGRLNFLLICTWAEDEPYEEVIQAFSKLPDDMVLYVTGNDKGKAAGLPFEIPPNVILTGFISNQEFDQLLVSSDCIIDLTKREDCLVCGAYESISVGKPLILSDTKVLRAYFEDAAQYTENDTDSIVQSVLGMSSDLPDANDRVIAYRDRQQDNWDSLKQNLMNELGMTG